jgi:hypothetical protein
MKMNNGNKEIITFYWSRVPGKFVNKHTGEEVALASGINFNGSPREWYQGLLETIVDVGNKVKLISFNIKVSPSVRTIFETYYCYRCDIENNKGYNGTLLGSICSEQDSTIPSDEVHIFDADNKLVGKVVVLDNSII